MVVVVGGQWWWWLASELVCIFRVVASVLSLSVLGESEQSGQRLIYMRESCMRREWQDECVGGSDRLRVRVQRG